MRCTHHTNTLPPREIEIAVGKTESQRSFARTTRAHLAKTAALILLTALAAATLLSSCAQEEALPNEARIDSTTFRYPDTAKPHKDEPSSSTVKTAGGFTYTEKHLDFQNDERTLFFVVYLCEGISYDDALAYAKTAPNATNGGETSEDEVALLEKYQIDPGDLPAVAIEPPQEAEVGGRDAFTQISTAVQGEDKAVHFVQCVEAGDGSIVYLDAYLPEQTFLQNEEMLRAVGQSIRIDEAK